MEKEQDNNQYETRSMKFYFINQVTCNLTAVVLSYFCTLFDMIVTA